MAILLSSLSACEDDDFPEKDLNASPQRGIPFPVGALSGTAVSKEIGTDGGELWSEDGKLRLLIPEGALEATKTISIQPIESTNPGGRGKGYRLSPHNINFKKPVTIDFSYEELELQGTFEEGLKIAYQDDKGIWKAMGNSMIDKVAKIVSVETDHFSDWTVFESLVLLPGQAILQTGESMELKVMRCVPLRLEDLLVPLVNPGEYEIFPYEALPASMLGDWSLGGSGNLYPNGASARYVAPDRYPNRNPVSVSVEVRSENDKRLLVSEIRIMADGILFRIDGGDWIHSKDVMDFYFAGENSYALMGAAPITSSGEIGSVVQFFWEGASQTKTPWLHEEVLFQYMVTPNFMYTSLYGPSGESVSGGYLHVDKYGKIGEYIEGTFLVTNAGLYDFNRQFPFVGVHKIEGYFRVKRTM